MTKQKAGASRTAAKEPLLASEFAPSPAPVAPPEPSPTYRPSGSATPAGTEIVLRARNLRKEYKNVAALEGIDVEVRRGEVVGFLGPNGAGKTTFTKCVLGLVKPTSGSVELFGFPVRRSTREALQRVGVVPDQYDFYGNLNSRQHLRFYGRLAGIPASQLEGRIEEVLLLVGMTEHADRRVREYSHGMKQRLCIAQAILHNPDFIIFDEPTNGLDPRGAFEVREMIKALSRQGRTIFLSSHILTEVEAVCTRVVILARGRILKQATVTDLRKQMRGSGPGRVRVRLEESVPGVEDVPVKRGIATQVQVSGNEFVWDLAQGSSVGDLIAALVQAGAKVQSAQEETVGLEQIFLELTKGEGTL
jgi:ABC-2 type transport system ATP-binding protein